MKRMASNLSLSEFGKTFNESDSFGASLLSLDFNLDKFDSPLEISANNPLDFDLPTPPVVEKQSPLGSTMSYDLSTAETILHSFPRLSRELGLKTKIESKKKIQASPRAAVKSKSSSSSSSRKSSKWGSINKLDDFERMLNSNETKKVSVTDELARTDSITLPLSPLSIQPADDFDRIIASPGTKRVSATPEKMHELDIPISPVEQQVETKSSFFGRVKAIGKGLASQNASMLSISSSDFDHTTLRENQTRKTSSLFLGKEKTKRSVYSESIISNNDRDTESRPKIKTDFLKPSSHFPQSQSASHYSVSMNDLVPRIHQRSNSVTDSVTSSPSIALHARSSYVLSLFETPSAPLFDDILAVAIPESLDVDTVSSSIVPQKNLSHSQAFKSATQFIGESAISRALKEFQLEAKTFEINTQTHGFSGENAETQVGIATLVVGTQTVCDQKGVHLGDVSTQTEDEIFPSEHARICENSQEDCSRCIEVDDESAARIELLESENVRLLQELSALSLMVQTARSQTQQMKILKEAAESRFEQLARVAHRKLIRAMAENRN